MSEESFHDCTPKAEAHGLYQMLRTGSTVKELRKLIAIPPRTEQSPRALARAHTENFS